MMGSFTEIIVVVVVTLVVVYLAARGIRWLFRTWMRKKILAALKEEDDGPRPCPHCGYDLRGAELPECPECGKAWGFDVSLEELGVDVDEAREHIRQRNAERQAQ